MVATVKILVFLGAAALAAACDRTATGVDDIGALLPSSTSTLPALFRESIAKVDRTNGPRAVDNLLADWRSLQEELKAEAPSAARGTIQAKLAAIHNEELEIVEKVLGPRVVARLIGDNNVGLAEARAHILAAEASGADMASARSVAVEVEKKMTAARRALAAARTREALDAGTSAAATLAGLRYFLIEGRRIAGLESLLPRVAEKLEVSNDNATLIALETLKKQTTEALRSGDRAASQLRLAELRRQNIKVVLRVLGHDVAVRIVDDVDARAKEVQATVASLKTNGRDVTKLERMTREAIDLNIRARAALKKGDAETALDLGSHAAGILNAVQHLTWN